VTDPPLALAEVMLLVAVFERAARDVFVISALVAGVVWMAGAAARLGVR
jgi:predicted RND superfamily exporter protein